MPTYFEVTQIEDGYSWRDFMIADMAFDYAMEVLEIPAEYIEEIECLHAERKMAITLVEAHEMGSEDWYCSLLPYRA